MWYGLGFIEKKLIPDFKTLSPALFRACIIFFGIFNNQELNDPFYFKQHYKNILWQEY